MADVTPILQPDPNQMRRHLAHLFDGWLDGLHDGLVELAWTDGRDGRLRHAQLYGTDQLDELVEQAVQVNSVPRQNVYVGQALRKPGTAPFGRTSDIDVLAMTTLYVDLDEDVLASARDRYRTGRCPPTAVVVTGRQPYVRSQLLWRLETPEQDLDLCRKQNAALARALGGDPSVVNPSRVLRVAGSVAWPMKPGRVIEHTEFLEFTDGRAKVYPLGQIARAFTPANDDAPMVTPSATSGSATLNIGTPDAVSVDGCLAAIRAGQHWHNNMVRLVGHWISRGWSDAEIMTAAEALTLPGYAVDQTRAEVARMMEGGRRKWNIANPRAPFGDADHLGTTAEPLAPAFIDSLAVTMLPRRPWVLGRSLIRGHVTVEVAPPGVGKSTLSIEQAVAIVTGEPITGQEVHETGKVWIYNNEDDAIELKRRLAAVLQHWTIPFATIRGQLALNSGADRPLMVARADREGNVIRLPDVDACIAQIRAAGIRVLIVDPFVETHAVEENANEQIKAVAALFREIARQGNCAVLLVHHTAKPPQGSSEGHAGNMNTARGASALVGVARVVQTLFAMSSRDAERHGIAEGERHRYIRLDDAKANLGLVDGRAHWFRRVGVTIANGDEVGVLVPEELDEPKDEAVDEPDDLHRTLIACLLARVEGDSIGLNAAARLLAWGDDVRFLRYRQTDDKGNRRVSQTLRDAILAACRQGVTITSGDGTAGFTCDLTASPRVLRRFRRAPGSADPAASPFAPTPQETAR